MDIDIEKYQKPGCYCITIDNRIVYIGKSVNIYHRFNQHRSRMYSESNTKQKNLYLVLRLAKRYNKQVSLYPLYWSQKTEEDKIKLDITLHEAALIRKYLPPLNAEIPKLSGKRDYINKKAYTTTLAQIMQLPESEFEIKYPD